mmetsp:Transcript_17144/g.24810  ORF Transcript_17144/g.24810 Transcript_17144/m.24810 type:complete len:225 (+) Transcript_17144:314-988(+)
MKRVPAAAEEGGGCCEFSRRNCCRCRCSSAMPTTRCRDRARSNSSSRSGPADNACWAAMACTTCWLVRSSSYSRSAWPRGRCRVEELGVAAWAPEDSRCSQTAARQRSQDRNPAIARSTAPRAAGVVPENDTALILLLLLELLLWMAGTAGDGEGVGGSFEGALRKEEGLGTTGAEEATTGEAWRMSLSFAASPMHTLNKGLSHRLLSFGASNRLLRSCSIFSG